MPPDARGGGAEGARQGPGRALRGRRVVHRATSTARGAARRGPVDAESTAVFAPVPVPRAGAAARAPSPGARAGAPARPPHGGPSRRRRAELLAARRRRGTAGRRWSLARDRGRRWSALRRSARSSLLGRRTSDVPSSWARRSTARARELEQAGFKVDVKRRSRPAPRDIVFDQVAERRREGRQGLDASRCSSRTGPAP